jgi:hypothetical protein
VPGQQTRFERTAEVAARDAEILRARSELHLSYRQLAERFQMSKSGVEAAIQRGLRAIVAEPAADVRAMELERLDQLARAALGVLGTNHPTVSQGRLVRGEDGRPIADPMPRLHAIDRLLRISDRRAKLLGLDAPVKADLRVTDGVDAQLEQLAAELHGLEVLDADVLELGPADVAGE